MRIKSTILFTLILMSGLEASAYQPAGNRIMTAWGENIDPMNVWKSEAKRS